MARSHFHNRLREKVAAVIEARAADIAAGKLSGDDAATIGMNYRQQVGHLAGLNEALAIADEIEQEGTS